MQTAGASAEPANRSKPNVILIMTDDQGYGDLACLGNPWIDSPNIDQLYADSIRLTDFHVSPMLFPHARGTAYRQALPPRRGAADETIAPT